MLELCLTTLYEYELNFNRNIQKQFRFAEPVLRFINDYLDPIFILNVWLPLVGASSHKLLVHMVTSLGVVNSLASVTQWCFPEFRPNWWLKENIANFKFNFKNIKIDAYSCDTSAGFPSSTAAAFTAFLIILFKHLPSAAVEFKLCPRNLSSYFMISLLTGFMWCSRLYFLYEFLHQCLIGSLLAVIVIHFSQSKANILLCLTKLKALSLVVLCGLIPVTVYYAMLCTDVDPFWSVRMAFKWCGDPLYLKHETSPVFTLCRDFGYLMGVALSCPLAKTYQVTNNTYRKRLPVLLTIEIVNAGLNSYTPKQYGRFIFVAYEFLRNCFHSFMLLTILPKFEKK